MNFDMAANLPGVIIDLARFPKSKLSRNTETLKTFSQLDALPES